MSKVPAKHRTREQWVEALKALERKTFGSLRESVESLIEYGRGLISAKAALPHGTFLPMVRENLQISEDQAERLMRIARNPRIVKSATRGVLPKAVSALLVLTNISEEDFDAGIASGAINPGTTAREAKRIKFTVVHEEPHVARIPVTRGRTDEVQRTWSPPERTPAEERRFQFDAIDGAISGVVLTVDRLEGLGLDLALAELEPAERDDFKALVEKALAALTTLYQAIERAAGRGEGRGEAGEIDGGSAMDRERSLFFPKAEEVMPHAMALAG